MTTTQILFYALLSTVIISYTLNITQALVEGRTLKREGKTPLTYKNLTTVTLAGLGELLAVYTLTKLAGVLLTGVFNLKFTPSWVVVIFIIIYLMKNVTAYLVAWATWTSFIYFEKKKEINKIKKEHEGAL